MDIHVDVMGAVGAAWPPPAPAWWAGPLRRPRSGSLWTLWGRWEHLLGGGWVHYGVHEAVVARLEAGGVGVANPRHLDGGGMVRQHPEPVVGRVPRQLHQDVHLRTRKRRGVNTNAHNIHLRQRKRKRGATRSSPCPRGPLA
eukprot:712374-Prorocentrum_minimum.AAC.1